MPTPRHQSRSRRKPNHPPARSRRGAHGKRKPHSSRNLAGAGALALGAGGAALAAAVGAGELMIGAFVAFVAYRMIRFRVSPKAALIEGVELERGVVPKSVAKAA